MIDDSGETGGERTEPKSERVRSRQRQRRKTSLFQRWRVELSLLLLAAVGLSLILIWLLPTAMPAEGSEGGQILPTWQLILPYIGAMLLSGSLIGGASRLRYRINYHEAWWLGPCPRCDKGDLYRAHRRKRDRLLGMLGIPVRRYVCSECHWVGTRIDQSRI